MITRSKAKQQKLIKSPKRETADKLTGKLKIFTYYYIYFF